VGTRFDVDMRPSRTTVTVVEGRVALLPEGRHAAPAAQLPILGVADRLVINRSGPVVTESGTNVAAAIAWTQRQLVFEHRPLGEVAEELNRYNRGRIRIEDARLRQQEITGTFQSNDTASFVDFLSNIPGVVIQDDGAGGRIVTVDDTAAARQ
jgi:transmembrane sensor